MHAGADLRSEAASGVLAALAACSICGLFSSFPRLGGIL